MFDVLNSFFALSGTQFETLPLFVMSLAIGLLLGVERERKNNPTAGIRTFMLASFLATLMGLLGELAQLPWLGVMGIVAIMFLNPRAPNPNSSSPQIHTTTQIALLIAYGLGLLVWYKLTELAVALAIIATLTLYLKAELVQASQKLSRTDLLSLLQFAAVSLIILPILPDQGFGPYQAFNPYNIWLMVVLIAGVGWAGYVAVMIVGEKAGGALLGFLGGLVSSTAASMTYSREVKNNPNSLPFAATVILLANLVLLLRLIGIAAVLSPQLTESISIIMGAGFVAGMLYVLIYRLRAAKQSGGTAMELRNPTEMRTALIFGLIYALVTFFSAWLSDLFGNSGLYFVALVSGISDLDAIALSSFHMFNQNKIDTGEVATILCLAILSNSAFKFGLIYSLGGKALAKVCAPMFILAVSAMFIASWLFV